MDLERREYGPDSTPEEVALIRARVRRVTDDLLEWHELPVLSAFQFDVMQAELDRLASEMPRYALLVDVTDGARPTAADRARLRTLFTSAGAKAFHVAVFTGRNLLLNAAAHFVLGGLGLASHSVHRTRDQAIEAIDLAR